MLIHGKSGKNTVCAIDNFFWLLKSFFFKSFDDFHERFSWDLKEIYQRKETWNIYNHQLKEVEKSLFTNFFQKILEGINVEIFERFHIQIFFRLSPFFTLFDEKFWVLFIFFHSLLILNKHRPLWKKNVILCILLL